MRKAFVLAVVVVAVVASTPAVLPAAAASSINVQDVTVDPSRPDPGEPTTVRTTIAVPESSSGSVDVTSVAIRRRGSSEELARIRNIGDISPGSSSIVPLTVKFDSTGTKVLTVHVYGNSADGRKHVQYPLTVTVGAIHPGLDVQTDDAVAGVREPGTVKVANGLGESISNVDVSVTGDDGVTISNSDSVFARLQSGESRSTNFSFRASEPGDHTITTKLTYLTSAGTERTTRKRTTISADPLNPNVALSARPVGTGTGRSIAVDVINQGNAPIRDVSITGTSPNATVRQALVGTVQEGTTKTAVMNLTLQSSTATVDLTATYDVGDNERQTTTSTTIESARGTIQLTGVEVSREAGKYHITGSTSNVGLTDAESVLVEVVETENVTPVAPNREYFVGSVPKSSFASFDVYARTTGEVTAIPVRVVYYVDATRERQIVRIPLSADGNGGAVDPNQAQNDGNDGGGGMSPLLILIGVAAVVVVLVGAVLAYYYRSSGGDDLEV